MKRLDSIKEMDSGDLYRVSTDDFDSVTFVEDGDFSTGLSEDQEEEAGKLISKLAEVTGHDTTEITNALAPLYSDAEMHEVNVKDLEYMIIASGESMEEDEDALSEIAEILSERGDFDYDKEEADLQKRRELEEQVEELESELDSKDETIQELENTVEEYRDEKKFSLAEEIVDIRDKKGLLDDKDRDDKVDELKDKNEEVLEELLEETKAISEEVSDPEPKVKENTGETEPTKESGKTMEDYREELFGYRKDGDD